MVRQLLVRREGTFSKNPIFVETGSGLSTIALAEVGRKLDARIYSCDVNQEKMNDLKKCAGEQVVNVIFLIGDSVDSLHKIVLEHRRIDFVFLDSAPSAIHTFREFQTIEQCLKAGSSLLIDNAALPQSRLRLSPCRKGKIIVPYLLASPYWEIEAHPNAGGSMISALYHDEPKYADPSYECFDYIDPWRSHFSKHANMRISG